MPCSHSVQNERGVGRGLWWPHYRGREARTHGTASHGATSLAGSWPVPLFPPSLGEMMGNRLAQIPLVSLERSCGSKGVFAALCQLAKVPASERGPRPWEGCWLSLTSGLGIRPGAGNSVPSTFVHLKFCKVSSKSPGK